MAEGLSSGFLTRHRDMKSVKSGVNFSGSFSVGGGLVGIMNIACRGRERERERGREGGREREGENVSHTDVCIISHSHWVDVSVRWSALCHLQGRDA